MNYTANKIEHIEFDVDSKGYSAKEVDGFIDKLVEDYQEFENNTFNPITKEVAKHFSLTKSFENFVVSDNNADAYNLAYTFSLGFSTKQKLIYIYGKSDLGKTHLLKGIEHHFLQNRTGDYAYYSIEAFNDILKQYDYHLDLIVNRLLAFTLVMIDDFHLIDDGGRKDLIVSLFEELNKKKIQIALAGNIAPLEYENESLRTFNDCQNVEVKKPDFNSRLKYYAAKVREEGINIYNKEAFDALANYKINNYRDMDLLILKLRYEQIKNKIENNSLTKEQIEKLILGSK